MKHIVFIHGIGDASFKVAESFVQNMSAETAHMGVEIHTFFWKGLISKKEERLKRIISKFPKRALLSLDFNIKETIETYLVIKLKGMLINYFGDAVFYMSDNSKKVKALLEKVLFDIAKADSSAEISLVAHSLGSVIAFDLLADRKFQKRMKRRLTIKHFFTVGSPLPLFLLRDTHSIKRVLPITGSWRNIYDDRDIVASKLAPFFPQCSDSKVRVQGANSFNVHLRYFSDPAVIDVILREMQRGV